MQIDYPAPHHLPQLRQLWQNAFGDTDAFLDSFYRTAYAPDHCRCILIGGQVAAVLYWIDCTLKDQQLAYIYAVVTHPAHRGKGLCRCLMRNTHELLRAHGYEGTILVPQKESLRAMYAGMGYQNVGGLMEFTCTAGDEALPLRAVGPEEFAALRRSMLPPGAVLQEGTGLAFLAEQIQFYSGDDILLAAYKENKILHVPELLGSRNHAPGILNALGCIQGIFRVPGTKRPFAMFHLLKKDGVIPDYFGFAFD